MGLEPGTADATSGMAKAIFDTMDELLAPPLEAQVAAASAEAKPGAQDALDKARDGWRKMSFAIATGVIAHLEANMEVVGVQTRGDVAAAVNGSTGPAPPGPHVHTVGLTASQSAVTFTQSNDGTGHVK
jgi:hypothetical protein